jgi:hypothetical protein
MRRPLQRRHDVRPVHATAARYAGRHALTRHAEMRSVSSFGLALSWREC